MRTVHAAMVAAMLAGLALGGCGSEGRLFPDIQAPNHVGETPPPVLRQPVLPEMLVNCRGHVLVPALGMVLVPKGKEPPTKGEYLREERLTPPYRILPPGAHISAEQSPTRLNVELDAVGRIIGLYCG